MKTKTLTTLAILLFSASIFAQSNTRVRAVSTEISDNLDLRAVASAFGDSRDLADFEQRLNDPRNQICNLDLDSDNRVDYLRVIEKVENYTHLIIVQAVVGRDLFQDVATLEIDRNRNRIVQVQIVGNPYFYGSNYIYEPLYVNYPVIYNHFYLSSYRPYHSVYYYNNYPTYYTYWQPYPVYRYQRNIYHCINVQNTYTYVNVRRNQRAVALYQPMRANSYATMHPNRSFNKRHATATNAHEIQPVRTAYATGGIRSNPSPTSISAPLYSGSSTIAQPMADNFGQSASNGGIRTNSATGAQNAVGSTPSHNGGIRTQSYIDASPRNPVRTINSASGGVKNTQSTSNATGGIRSTNQYQNATPRPTSIKSENSGARAQSPGNIPSTRSTLAARSTARTLGSARR